MDPIRIGVLGPSDIAFRRTIPAFINSECFTYKGVACATVSEWSDDGTGEDAVASNLKRAESFLQSFGGKTYLSYEEMLNDPNIEAVYIPLPPGLHFRWAKKAIECGKHVFLEKPFTTSPNETEQLIELSRDKDVAVHENFAFVFHRQFKRLADMVENGEIGELRLIRAIFSFPYRGENDFRYHKNIGGGALLDCGGYPIRLAGYFLGDTARVTTSTLSYARGHDVDVYGSATLQNDNGQVAQISFGMDNSYRCEVEIFGSEASVSASRIFTPTASMNPVLVYKSNEEKHIEVEADDQFQNSAEYFYKCIFDERTRDKNRKSILAQSNLMNISN